MKTEIIRTEIRATGSVKQGAALHERLTSFEFIVPTSWMKLQALTTDALVHGPARTLLIDALSSRARMFKARTTRDDKTVSISYEWEHPDDVLSTAVSVAFPALTIDVSVIFESGNRIDYRMRSGARIGSRVSYTNTVANRPNSVRLVASIPEKGGGETLREAFFKRATERFEVAERYRILPDDGYSRYVAEVKGYVGPEQVRDLVVALEGVKLTVASRFDREYARVDA